MWGVVAAAVGAIVAAGLALVISRFVTNHWDEVRRQREADGKSLDEFYALYGAFIALWRRWNDAVLNAVPGLGSRGGSASSGSSEDSRSVGTAPPEPDYGARTSVRYASVPPDVVENCMAESSTLEGRLEALLIRTSVERELTDDQILDLSCFREAFQELRSAQVRREPLRWYKVTSEEAEPQPVSRSVGEETYPVLSYRAFKLLSERFAHMLQQPAVGYRILPGRRDDRPSSDQSLRAWSGITVQARSNTWVALALRESSDESTQAVPSQPTVRRAESSTP